MRLHPDGLLPRQAVPPCWYRPRHWRWRPASRPVHTLGRLAVIGHAAAVALAANEEPAADGGPPGVGRRAGIMHWSWAAGAGTAPSSRSPVAPPRPSVHQTDVMPSVRKLVRGLAGMVLPAHRSYSQFGEDTFVTAFFGGEAGTWLDIGGLPPSVATSTNALRKRATR